MCPPLMDWACLNGDKDPMRRGDAGHLTDYPTMHLCIDSRTGHMPKSGSIGGSQGGGSGGGCAESTVSDLSTSCQSDGVRRDGECTQP